MVRVCPFIIDFLSLAFKRLSVHTTVVFLAVTVTDVRHGICSFQGEVSPILIELVRIFFKGYGNPLPYFIIELQTHFVQDTEVIF
jgi:hypothetical protein